MSINVVLNWFEELKRLVPRGSWAGGPQTVHEMGQRDNTEEA